MVARMDILCWFEGSQ